MPKPENIRRIVTGPKSANKSIRKSRSMGIRSRLYESSRRTPGPQRERNCAHRGAASSRFRSVAEAFSKQRCQGLWVPAFAGTTRASAIYLGGRKLHRLAATAGAGLGPIVADELD